NVTPNVGTTPIVFSSTRLTTSSGDKIRRSPSKGTSRSSTSKYRANLCQHICTGPQIRLGLSVGLPCACIFLRHCHFSAKPPSIAASDEPVVEQPRVLAASGECQRSASIC